MRAKLCLLAVCLALLLPGFSLAANPPPPTNVTAIANGTSIVFTWTPAASGQGYNIFTAATSAALLALPNDLSGGPAPLVNGSALGSITLSTYTLTNVVGGTAFYAMDTWNCPTGGTCAESAYTTPISVTVGGGTPMPTPAPVTTNGTATLTWTAPTTDVNGNALATTAGDALTGFNVLEGVGAATPTQLATVGPTVLTYAATGLTATSYTFEVEAVNAAGTSAPSPEITATNTVPTPTPAAAPGEPMTFTVTCTAPSGGTCTVTTP